MQIPLLVAGFGAILLASLLVAPRRVSVEGFFGGRSATGAAPTLWVLVLSRFR